MLCLKWEKSYSTQIDIIDCQLMDIIETINVIIRSVNADKNNQEIFEILKSLLSYTTYHFKTEEQLMMQVSFPDKWQQLTECETFMQIMQNYLYLIGSGKDISRQSLVEFLNKWIQLHIKNVNRCFKSCDHDQIAI